MGDSAAVAAQAARSAAGDVTREQAVDHRAAGPQAGHGDAAEDGAAGAVAAAGTATARPADRLVAEKVLLKRTVIVVP